jgi:tripartite-type tricarboxylate transporter receptor subunit TctC
LHARDRSITLDARIKETCMRSVWTALVLSAACVAAAGAAQPDDAASTYPRKPIRWIIDFPAGGLSDVLARSVSPKLQESLGQPIVTDPRPGAGGLLAYGLAARSAPDGYTLAFISAPFTVNLNLYDKLPYDTFKDFVPVASIATTHNVLLTSPKLPVKTVSELIAYAKTKPAGLNFGSVGVGSSPHLTGELFKARSGVNATHVPFQGSGPALTDLMAARLDFMFVNYPSAFPHIKSGRVNMIATAGPKRLHAFPEVPTLIESGFPGFRSVGWFGVAAPGATPKPITAKLNATITRIVKLDDVRERLDTLGVEPAPMTQDEFRAFLIDETKRWEKVIKDSGAKASS